MDAVDGHAVLEELTATGGSGMGIDLGLAARHHEGWRAGVAVHNLFGNILWSRGATRYRQTVDADSVKLDDVEEDSDVILTESEDSAAPSFRRSLPPILVAGVARAFSWGMVEADLEQGLREGATTSTTPRVAVGVARRVADWSVARLGLAAGGADGPALSLGVGFRFWRIELEGAYITAGTVNPLSGKGAGIGLSLGYRPASLRGLRALDSSE
ncbi:MAG: hypothetical protein GF355_05945 [Candidatus Eisenbacteria bacterium]|nr:hypothetical protein [Candidatus Eisenbacteria bacterium]